MKIEHLGIAVKSLGFSDELFQKLLGKKSYKKESVQREGVTTSFYELGESKIELLEAANSDSPIAKFLDKRGEGIHHIAFGVENIEAEIETQKNEYFADTKKSLEDWSPDFPQTWEQNSYMKKFSKLNDFMTVHYKSDGYTGGAHGYYNELYRVFDVKTNRQVHLGDILKVRDAKIWSRILMDHFLKNDLDQGQAQMLLVKEIPLNDNFYFDQDNLYFLYNQYEIAAYAAGPVLIKIPYSEIKPFLTQDFRTKLNLN